MAHAQWLEALQAFHATHLARLQEAYAIGLQAVEAKQLPDINAIEPEVLQTTIWTLALATVFIVPQLRRLVLNTVESVLTVILLLLLLAFILAVVLGMPFAVGYIAIKGGAFLSASLLRTFPQLQALVNHVQQLISKTGSA